MKLSRSEEQLMQHLWKLEKAFMKDIIESYDEPKPATTTIATLLKRIRNKGFIDYHLFGNSREYFPTVSKSSYFGTHLKSLINNFFDDSASQFASFFTSNAELSKEELMDLRKIIDQEIKKKK